MVDIPVKKTEVLGRDNVLSINKTSQTPLDSRTVFLLNKPLSTRASNVRTQSQRPTQQQSYAQRQQASTQSQQQSYGQRQTSTQSQQQSYAQRQTTQSQQSSYGQQASTQSTQQSYGRQQAASSQPSYGYQQPSTQSTQQSYGRQPSTPNTQQSYGQRQQTTPRTQPNNTRSQSVQQPVPHMRIPVLLHTLQRGQKTSLGVEQRGNGRVHVCFGWNVTDMRCDVDVSAFLVGANGKVPSDDWFVFYGQDRSPDGSVQFAEDHTGQDREVLTVDTKRVDGRIQRIIFVMTIHEAFENRLNFSMIQDAYMRLLDQNTGKEIFSYRMDNKQENITSMTIGELYLHSGLWKFNPVGNGVHQDLAGQCAIYGVAIA